MFVLKPGRRPETAARRVRRPWLLSDPIVAGSLVSVAGLVGAPVRNQVGNEVGSLADVVVSWRGDPYPAVTGLVVRVARRQSWVPAGQVEVIEGLNPKTWGSETSPLGAGADAPSSLPPVDVATVEPVPPQEPLGSSGDTPEEPLLPVPEVTGPVHVDGPSTSFS